MTTLAEKIYEAAKPLPEPLALALEALHFIEFLRSRAEREDSLAWLSAQETALTKLWDNTEDEVWSDAPILAPDVFAKVRETLCGFLHCRPPV